MTRATLPAISLLLTSALACNSEGLRGEETFANNPSDDEAEGSESGGSESSSEGSESDTSTSTSEGCPIGAEGCPCTGGGSCDAGLVCEGGTCVPEAGTDGSSEGSTDTTSDTGAEGCTRTYEFEFLAVDADEIVGWEAQMSMLGEGMILAWADDPDAYVRWNLGIPCDDDWHVWVRGHDLANDDSYLVTVDDDPMPAGVFEIDCTGAPAQGTYVWRELNLRELDAGPCEYTADPWIQSWAGGFHSVELGYREAVALSKIWITNTDQPPP